MPPKSSSKKSSPKKTPSKKSVVKSSATTGNTQNALTSMPPVEIPADVKCLLASGHQRGSRRVFLPRDLFRAVKLRVDDWVRVDRGDGISAIARAWPADDVDRGDRKSGSTSSSTIVIDTTMQEYHKHAHADSIARIQKLVVSMPEVDEHVTLTVEYFDKRTLTQSYAGPSATISSSLVHAAAQRLLVGCAIAVNLVFDHWKEDVALKVVEVRPPNEHYVLVPSNCSLILKEIRVDPRESSTSSMTMDEDVATAEHTATLLPPSSGMDVPYEALREMLVYPLKYAHAFAALNIDCPKGLLLSGPPGVGKTFLAARVARECNARLVTVHSQDIVSPFAGDSEKMLRDVFAEAQEWATGHRRPCVVFVDELDALAPKRDDATQQDGRLVAQLLTILDGMDTGSGRVVVIGATNRANAIDPALRRPGRLEREIVLPVPSTDDRLAILLEKTAKVPLAKDVELLALAERTRGFVGADLNLLVQEASMRALRRCTTVSYSALEHPLPSVAAEDFQYALRHVMPSLQRGYQRNLDQRLSWDNLGGVDAIRHRLEKAIEWPLRYRQTFDRLSLRPCSGVVLYGPPGCSKTSMVRIMAKTCGLRFFSVSATDGSGGEGLLSPYVGDGEYRLRELFRTARAIGPSLIFFDEMESLFAKRELGESQTSGVQERLLATLLNEMDGVGAQGEGVRQDATQVVVVGATNRPDKLDAALLRPGRFDHLVYVPPPDAAARRAILEVQWRRTPVDERLRHDEALMQKFIDKTEGYSGADIVGLCQHAGMLAMDRLCGSRNAKGVDEQDYVVTLDEFERAIDASRSSIPQSLLEMYRKYQERMSGVSVPIESK